MDIIAKTVVNAPINETMPDLTIAIIAILAIAIALMPIILFFKIWNMTNDIKDIREILEDTITSRHQSELKSNEAQESHNKPEKQ